MNSRIFGASVQGPGHIRRGVPNQDSFLFRRCRRGIILAVSDGVGSRELSHLGSRAACQAAAEAGEKFLAGQGRDPDPRCLEEMIHALWCLNLSPEDPDRCCATLLFALVTRKCVVLGRQGDGMICARIRGEDLLITEDKEDSFSNVTWCLRKKFTPDQMAMTAIPLSDPGDLEHLLLATDGVADDVPDSKKASFAASFAGEYSRLPAKKRTRSIRKMLKEWPVPHHSDDKTVLCLAGTCHQVKEKNHD